MQETKAVAVIAAGESAAAAPLRRVLRCPVEVWSPYDVAMGRADCRDYRAVVVENFRAEPSGALSPCAAARWAMENELIPDLNDEGTAPEEMKFYPDNAVSKLDVLNAWQKAQELKQNA